MMVRRAGACACSGTLHACHSICMSACVRKGMSLNMSVCVCVLWPLLRVLIRGPGPCTKGASNRRAQCPTAQAAAHNFKLIEVKEYFNITAITPKVSIGETPKAHVDLWESPLWHCDHITYMSLILSCNITSRLDIYWKQSRSIARSQCRHRNTHGCNTISL